MSLTTISLKINPPTEYKTFGRGFYQLEEEELYFPVEYKNERTRFFSFLDSEFVSLHLDKSGRLIFIEITAPRRRWKYRENLIIPERARPADIRFLDFRQSFSTPEIFCDKTRENLMVRFLNEPAVNNYFMAENLIAQTNDSNALVSLWIANIIDDLAGKEILLWRSSIRGEIAKPVKRAI